MIGLRLVFTVTLVFGGLFSPVVAEAQQAAKIARIGYLGDDPAAGPHLRGAFLQGLRDLGYVEGRNLVIEYRFVEGQHEQLPARASELVALKVDVIVAGTTLGALAAKQAVNAWSSSKGRSGVNRVAVLWQPGAADERAAKDMSARAEDAGRTLGVQLQFVETRGPADFDGSFSKMTRAHAGALTVLPSAMFFNERKRLVDLAAKHRLPVVYMSREFVDAGASWPMDRTLLICIGALRRTWTRFSRAPRPPTYPSSGRRSSS